MRCGPVSPVQGLSAPFAVRACVVRNGSLLSCSQPHSHESMCHCQEEESLDSGYGQVARGLAFVLWEAGKTVRYTG